MRKELLTLAVACLLCVPAFAADDEEPKGVSDIKEVGKVIRNPITIEATGGKQKMDVVFNHSSHRRVRCQTCHHALPSDIDAKYVSCGASEECHSVPRGDDGVAPSLSLIHISFFDASIYPPVHGRWAGTSKMHTKSEAQERHTPLINFIHNGPTVSAQGVLAPSFIQAPGSPRQNFPGSPNHGPYTGTREKTLSHPRLKKPPSLRRRAQSFPNSSSVP